MRWCLKYKYYRSTFNFSSEWRELRRIVQNFYHLCVWVVLDGVLARNCRRKIPAMYIHVSVKCNVRTCILQLIAFINSSINWSGISNGEVMYVTSRKHHGCRVASNTPTRPTSSSPWRSRSSLPRSKPAGTWWWGNPARWSSLVQRHAPRACPSGSTEWMINKVYEQSNCDWGREN